MQDLLDPGRPRLDVRGDEHIAVLRLEVVDHVLKRPHIEHRVLRDPAYQHRPIVRRDPRGPQP